MSGVEWHLKGTAKDNRLHDKISLNWLLLIFVCFPLTVTRTTPTQLLDT